MTRSQSRFLRALSILAVLLVPSSGLAQGVFYFENGGWNGAARAGVYGPDPSNPSLQLWGNTPDARPPGTQTYSGPLLLGTNFSAEGWYSLVPAADAYQLLPGSRAVAGTLTAFSSFTPGLFSAMPETEMLDFNLSTSNTWPYYVYLQVRAWDNAGGQYPTWSDAWNAANQGSGRAVGWSKTFYQPLDWIGSTRPYPGMINFESFNLFIVPEPSAIAILAVGAAALGLRSRRGRRTSSRYI